MLKAVLQGQQKKCHEDQPLQHPQHKLEDHHRIPQSTIKIETTRIHQNAMTPPMDPPEHLQMAKVQELLKQRRRHQNLTLELQQVQVLLLSLLTHQRTLSYAQDVAKVATGAEIVLYYNFCDFCRVTTHSTHMCTATKHGPGSPVCIYCGKTNHSSAYCRYRPRDNQEEPRHTPDALKTGATGKNLAPVARNQAGSTHHNTNNTPFFPYR